MLDDTVALITPTKQLVIPTEKRYCSFTGLTRDEELTTAEVSQGGNGGGNPGRRGPAVSVPFVTGSLMF